jgi:hypothetical protein
VIWGKEGDVKRVGSESPGYLVSRRTYFLCIFQVLFGSNEATLFATSKSSSFIMEPFTCLMMGVGLVFSLIVLQFLDIN